MGLPFLFQQISAAILVQAPTIIIAATIGAQSVGFYSVAARLATVAPIIVSLVAVPLWPAYAHAIAKSEYAWVSRTNFWVGIACALFALTYGCALMLGSNFVLSHLLGKDVETARALLPLVLAGSMATCLRWPSSMLLCAGGYIRGVTIAQCVTAVFATVLALYYGRQHDLHGLVLCFVICEWGLVTVQYALTYRILSTFSLKRIREEQAVPVT
jgi:O-antigen/teichoic acid export membrane protein